MTSSSTETSKELSSGSAELSPFAAFFNRLLNRAREISGMGRPDLVAELREISLTLADMEYESLVKRLEVTVGPYLTPIVARFDGPFIFRARLNVGSEPFAQVSDLGYMPAHLLHLLTGYGRANKPGEAIFYGSTQPFVACVETARDIYRVAGADGLNLTVGTWRVVKPLVVAILFASPKNWKQLSDLQNSAGINPAERKREFESWTVHAKKQNRQLQADLRSQVLRKNRRASVQLLQYFSDEFARVDAEEWHFKMTNYFKDVALSLSEIDGIWYRSVGYSFQYSNLALRPIAVEKKLRFECASAARMEPLSQEGTMRFRVLQEDVPADSHGKIAWRKASRSEMSGPHRIASIRSLADLAEAKLAPDRGDRPWISCLGLLIFGQPDLLNSSGSLLADLDELQTKCGNRTLILFAGYGKAVPFGGRRELGDGWLFSESLFTDVRQHVADRTKWVYSDGIDVLAFPIVLIQQGGSWSVEFHFDLGLVVDWLKVQFQFVNPGLRDFLVQLYQVAETEWENSGEFFGSDRGRVMAILSAVFPREVLAAINGGDPSGVIRFAGPGMTLPALPVPVRWKHPEQSRVAAPLEQLNS